MAAPFLERFFPLMSPQQQLARRIDDHYHLGMIARDSRMIADHSAQAFRMQHDAAIANLRGLGEIARRQDTTNSLLGQTNNLLSCVVGGIDQLNDTANAILHSVDFQTTVLQDGFTRQAQLLLAQQKTLDSISSTLAQPYETKVLELLKEADRALRQGMRISGRDQKAEFSDAKRLLKLVIENPIGSRNYVAWFQLGWLAWKDESNHAAAEEAFYQASRLSASSGDLYHSNGLSHQAYMQYFRKDYAKAHETIYSALRAKPGDHDIRYDAARYAAKLGRENDAIGLLDKCIDQQPQTIVTMFSEEDFSTMASALANLALRRTENSRQVAQHNVSLLGEALKAVDVAERQADCRIGLPASFAEWAAQATKDALTAAHVSAVALSNRAATAIADVAGKALTALEGEMKSRESRLTEAERLKSQALSGLRTEVSAAELHLRKLSAWDSMANPRWWTYVGNR
jgi:tetratricopeptide (TPR) repeat protein